MLEHSSVPAAMAAALAAITPAASRGPVTAPAAPGFVVAANFTCLAGGSAGRIPTQAGKQNVCYTVL
jgi:hypothetical protein